MKNVNFDNLLVIVDTVTYGKLVYQVLSTTNTSNQARKILEHDKKLLFQQLTDLADWDKAWIVLMLQIFGQSTSP